MQDYIGFEQVIEARLSGDPERLNEASLGRVFQHYLKSPHKSWAILTSWRHTNSPQDNAKDFKDLMARVRSLGLGYFRLVGRWKECIDPRLADNCPEHMLRDAAEPSLFVPGMTLKQAIRLGRKYEQDAVVYAGPETGTKGGKPIISLQYPMTGKTQMLGRMTPGKVAAAYSKVKGRPFVFECVAQTYNEQLMERLANLRNINESR